MMMDVSPTRYVSSSPAQWVRTVILHVSACVYSVVNVGVSCRLQTGAANDVRREQKQAGAHRPAV